MLGNQHKFIIDLLSDGKRHCSNEIPFRDYRRRVQDLIDGVNGDRTKYPIQKEACRGRCGRKHGANVNWLWLEDKITTHQFPQACCSGYGFYKLHNRDCPTLKEKELTGQLKML